jgi:hypothetical protein
MCDGTLNDLSTAEKLELLTAHADAWRNLKTAYREKADILMGWGELIAVSCNVMSRDGRVARPGKSPNVRMAFTSAGPKVQARFQRRWNLAWTFLSSAFRLRYVVLRLRTGCYLCP